MDVLTAQDRYETAKKNAKEYYSKIGRVWCPALNDLVIFNQAGFRHMIRKGRRPRPLNDQMRRFALLRFAKETIQSHAAKLIKEENDSLPPEWNFLALAERRNKQIITIVIRKNSAAENYFFSIYNQKIAQ